MQRQSVRSSGQLRRDTSHAHFSLTSCNQAAGSPSHSPTNDAPHATHVMKINNSSMPCHVAFDTSLKLDRCESFGPSQDKKLRKTHRNHLSSRHVSDDCAYKRCASNIPKRFEKSSVYACLHIRPILQHGLCATSSTYCVSRTCAEYVRVCVDRSLQPRRQLVFA